MSSAYPLHHEFFITTNLKTKSSLLLFEEFYWFIVANVVHKTRTQTLTALTAVPLCTRSVNDTLEATENTIDEWRTNVLVCPTVV
jgi:hypothetical protein